MIDAIDPQAASLLPRSIPSLTGIRGFAAFWVLAYHAMIIFAVPKTMWTAPIEHGWSGVDLFFVLSGFILMHAHGGDFQNITKVALKRFVWSRFVRVYPLNLAVLLVIAALFIADPHFAATKRLESFSSSFLATAFLITVWTPEHMTLNQPVWSLSAEVVGYVAFPLLAWSLMRLERSAVLIALAGFATMFFLRLALHQAFVNQLNTSGALIRLAGCFIGGAALWRLRSALPASWSRFAGPMATLSVPGIAICSMSYNLVEALPVLYGLLILALSYRRGIVDRFLSTGISTLLGALSFPLYLTHVTVLAWFQASFVAQDLSLKIYLLVTAVLTSVTLAAVFHWSVEKPVQKLCRRRTKLAGSVEMVQSSPSYSAGVKRQWRAE